MLKGDRSGYIRRVYRGSIVMLLFSIVYCAGCLINLQCTSDLNKNEGFKSVIPFISMTYCGLLTCISTSGFWKGLLWNYPLDHGWVVLS
jgi:hypothetical protein